MNNADELIDAAKLELAEFDRSLNKESVLGLFVARQQQKLKYNLGKGRDSKLWMGVCRSLLGLIRENTKIIDLIFEILKNWKIKESAGIAFLKQLMEKIIKKKITLSIRQFNKFYANSWVRKSQILQKYLISIYLQKTENENNEKSDWLRSLQHFIEFSDWSGGSIRTKEQEEHQQMGLVEVLVFEQQATVLHHLQNYANKIEEIANPPISKIQMLDLLVKRIQQSLHGNANKI